MQDGVRYHPDTGAVVHEPGVVGGERLDAYLARRLPGRDWYPVCDAGRVEVRDYRSPLTGTFTRERWYLTYPGGRIDLAAGERPRMRDGFCFVVREDVR